MVIHAEKGRKLLILGNGFDIAHGLPTRYTDFLDFCRLVMLYVRDEPLSPEEVHFLPQKIASLKWPDFIKQKIKEAFRDKLILKEIRQLIESNIWYLFFDEIYRNGKGLGPNWIDFENEIRRIIEFTDRQEEITLEERASDLLYYYENNHSYQDGVYNAENKLKLFGKKTKEILTRNNNDKLFEMITVKDLRKYWYQHLENIIEALNLYLAYFIDRIHGEDIRASENITKTMSFIEKIAPDYVLNFNYTHTYEFLYPKTEVFHIHGECTKESNKNNIVLGIDQYWKTEEERQEHVSYAIFKKYVQRIRKRTGNKHREILKALKEPISPLNVDGRYYAPEIYVFGHSLDRTDKDILANFFNAEVVVQNIGIVKEAAKVTVFYHDKETEGELIANMVSLIGEEKVLEKSEDSRLRFIELSEL